MGLQVEIIKITEPDPIKIENGKYLRLVDDNGNYDDSQFEKWALKHKTQTVETWLDLEKFKLKTGIDIQNDYDIDYISYDGETNIAGLIKKSDNTKITIDVNTIPVMDKKIDIVCYDNILYVRNPFKKKFYEDFNKGKTKKLLWTKKELMQYFSKYGIKKDPVKKEFMDLIDKFEEGKNVIYIAW